MIFKQTFVDKISGAPKKEKPIHKVPEKNRPKKPFVPKPDDLGTLEEFRRQDTAIREMPRSAVMADLSQGTLEELRSRQRIAVSDMSRSAVETNLSCCDDPECISNMVPQSPRAQGIIRNKSRAQEALVRLTLCGQCTYHKTNKSNGPIECHHKICFSKHLKSSRDGSGLKTISTRIAESFSAVMPSELEGWCVGFKATLWKRFLKLLETRII